MKEGLNPLNWILNKPQIKLLKKNISDRGYVSEEYLLVFPRSGKKLIIFKSYLIENGNTRKLITFNLK